MKGKLLVVDDEKRIRSVVSDFLVLEGYEILEAENGLEALEILDFETDIKMVIIDIMMPKLNGYEVCKILRKKSNIPIIVLTAKNQEDDELTGFDYGADEYITKPFSTNVLVARVNALYKRTYGNVETDVIEKGCMKLLVNEHNVVVDGKSKALSNTEMKLITYFIKNEGIVLTRDKILNDIWGIDYLGTDRTVDTHINRLRAKLGSAGVYIRTLHRTGYKFEVGGC